MIEAQSFFTSGGTLARSAKSYVTRRADRELLECLLGGEFCYVLTSRQMGKSSLMVRTADALRGQGVRVAILDLTRIGQNVSLEQWYGGLLLRLAASLNLEDELDAYWTSEQASRLGPMQRFMGALRDVALPAVKGNISIFIDEIDAVRSLPFSSDEFFAGVRECYNSRVSDPEFKRLSFCLLGVAQPSDLISNVYITPFNIGHRIELTDFTEAEAQPLLDGLRGNAATAESARAILHRVLYWAGGHPYLTQKLCETVMQLDREVTPKDVDTACADLFLSSRSREQQDNLIFVRDRVLASKENRAAILDLYARVLRGEKVRDDDSNATIDPLRLSGLLVVSNGFLKVRNRIYATVFERAWITANMPDAELRRQKAAYRRGIVRALAIGLPVLAVFVLLLFTSLYLARDATQQSYFVTTSQAQDAFNSGDFKRGNELVNSWDPSHSWWLTPVHWLTGREVLKNSFAMLLLRTEEQGDNTTTLSRLDPPVADQRVNESRLAHWMSFRHDPPAANKDNNSSCEAEVAVATTTFQNHALIAAAGTDSIVQIWDADTKAPFHHLKLSFTEAGTSGAIAKKVDGDLPSCGSAPNNGPGIMSLSFSPDGSKLAIATGSWRNVGFVPGHVLVWDLTGNTVDTLKSDFKRTVDSVRFSGDAQTQYLAASSEDSTAEIWRSSDGWSDPGIFPKIVDPSGQALRSVGGGRLGGNGANAIALSSISGHLLALGFGDGHIVLYDYLDCFRSTASKEQAASCVGPLYVGLAHVSGVMSMAFLQKQQNQPLSLAIGTRDGNLILYDTGALTAEYRKTHKNASASEAIEMDATDLQRATIATERPGQGELLGLAVRQDEDGRGWLLTSGSNGTVGLWTLTPRPTLLTTLNGHTAATNQVAFCKTPPRASQPAGEEDLGCIASVSADRTVRLWERPFPSKDENLSKEENQLPLVVPKRMLILRGQAVGVQFLDDRTLISAVGAITEGRHQNTQVIAAWNYTVPDVEVQAQPNNVPDKPILGFDTSPDRKLLVFTSRERNLVFVDLSTGLSQPLWEQVLRVGVTLGPKVRIRCLDAPDKIRPLPRNSDDPNAACPTRQYLVMGVADRSDIPDQTSGPGKGLCLWHIIDNGTAAGPTRFTIAPGTLNPCETPPISGSGQAPASSFRDDLRQTNMFDISANGKLIATSMNVVNKNGTCVDIWNTPDLLRGGKPDAGRSTPGCPNSSAESKDFSAAFVGMSFSPDGDHLAAATFAAELYYWSTRSTKEAHSPNPNLPDAVQRISLPARGQVLAFSPDRKTLAIGLQGGGVILWDTQFHRTIMEIHQHRGGVLGLAFSPDGETLASSGNDGTVRVLQIAPKVTD